MVSSGDTVLVMAKLIIKSGKEKNEKNKHNINRKNQITHNWYNDIAGAANSHWRGVQEEDHLKDGKPTLCWAGAPQKVKVHKLEGSHCFSQK